ncbi:unnamed protein product, partial [Iphiclides podalirius]
MLRGYVTILMETFPGRNGSERAPAAAGPPQWGTNRQKWKSTTHRAPLWNNERARNAALTLRASISIVQVIGRGSGGAGAQSPPAQTG